jgi:hypothetical protein
VVYEGPLAEHEPSGGHAVQYLSPNRIEPIVEIVASEERVALYYRTQKGELRKVGYGELTTGEEIDYWASGATDNVQQALLDEFARKLDSAIDRWVEE